ncbi:5-histidylcysteine sulfoxide synthase [Thalassotalea ganghwensis]
MTSITQAKTLWLDGGSVEQKRAELKAYFENTWRTYESLFALINDDDAFYLRPEPLRHPLIFYFGHTATFYVNKLMLGKYISERINPALEAICAVGVDEMSWDDLDSSHYDWPAVEDVRAYRDQVYHLVNQLIDNMELTLPINQDSLAWVLLMGCEHERIHLETSSVIMRMLPLQYLTPSAQWAPCPYIGKAPSNSLVSVPAQEIELNKADDDLTYGWDNEFGKCSIHVKSFQVSKYIVSNQEFLAFIEDGGYQNSSWWTEEGQRWLSYSKATKPRFWLKKSGGYFQRNLTEEIPLPLDWPVEVNYLEAKAFCHWKSAQSGENVRLLTEAEWRCLREMVPGDLPQWKEAPGNINLEYFASSCPINKFEHNGVYDICGNVWQWTESAIDGFNEFSVHPLYDDFSTPTFDGKHNLIKGGSWISTGNEAIKSSRYAFRRHFFQHAGFRYVVSAEKEMPTTPVNVIESNPAICIQLDSHYGGSCQYAQQLAQLVLDEKKLQSLTTNQGKSSKLLNLGCSVGRTAFELATSFESIDAVDFSAQTIQHAVKLQQGDSVRYATVNEGDIVDYHEISLATFGLPKDNHHVAFCQGDASNLKPIFTGYDVIVLDQVLENNYKPKQVLALLNERLNSKGILIISSSYCFDENITEKPNWLGGIKVNGENVTGFDGLSEQLKTHFSFVKRYELMQKKRFNRRCLTTTALDVTVWQKRD